MENNNTKNSSDTLPVCKETLAKILRIAIVDKRLTELSVRVLTYICLYCDDTSVTNDNICEILSISHRETIAKIWKNLIDTNWIVRDPKINPKTGKTIKGYLYRVSTINLTGTNQIVKPHQNRAQRSNAHGTKSCNPTEHQNDDKTTQNDVLSDSTHKNKGILINKPNMFLNNTPLTPLINDESNSGLKTFVELETKKRSPNISDNELIHIHSWINEKVTNAKNPLTGTAIILIIERLLAYSADGFNIVKLVVDSIEHPGNYLLKPNDFTYKTSNKQVNVKQQKAKRAFQFENDEYIRPENEMEKNTLASQISIWYKQKINPKNKKQMSSQEIEIIEKHQKVCFGTNGSFRGNWTEYIKQNEINCFTSLLDQAPNFEFATNKVKQGIGFQGISDLVNKLNQQRNNLGLKTL